MPKTKRVRRLKKNKITRKRNMSGGGVIKPKKVGGKYFFKDYPEFRPNLSPRDMFKLGSFGGTYWRPIKSGVLKKELKKRTQKISKVMVERYS